MSRPLKKKARDSLIGRISHNIQIASVDRPMTDVCTSAGEANRTTASRSQPRHIRLSLPASRVRRHPTFASAAP